MKSPLLLWLFIASVLLVRPGKAAENCPLNEGDYCGWLQTEDTCYKPFFHAKTRYEAEKTCEAYSTPTCQAKLLDVMHINTVAKAVNETSITTSIAFMIDGDIADWTEDADLRLMVNETDNGLVANFNPMDDGSAMSCGIDDELDCIKGGRPFLCQSCLRTDACSDLCTHCVAEATTCIDEKVIFCHSCLNTTGMPDVDCDACAVEVIASTNVNDCINSCLANPDCDFFTDTSSYCILQRSEGRNFAFVYRDLTADDTMSFSGWRDCVFGSGGSFEVAPPPLG